MLKSSLFPISRILVPVDLSDRCLNMLPYVRALAQRYAAEVVLLHVVNPIYVIPETGISAPVILSVPESYFTEKARALEGFAVAELRDLPVRRIAYEGDPETQIAAFVQSEDIQLVVMPTHGYGMFRRFLLGSVTAKVLHDVNCPVLTGVHAPAHSSVNDVRISTLVCGVDLNSHTCDVLQWASHFARDLQA
jgi:nucleotide-binding universal stress UspA family protein